MYLIRRHTNKENFDKYLIWRHTDTQIVEISRTETRQKDLDRQLCDFIIYLAWNDFFMMKSEKKSQIERAVDVISVHLLIFIGFFLSASKRMLTHLLESLEFSSPIFRPLLSPIFRPDHGEINIIIVVIHRRLLIVTVLCIHNFQLCHYIVNIKIRRGSNKCMLD